MESNCQSSDLNMKHMLGQLTAARNEINNLRQQIKNLRYMHEKDINNIKRLLELSKNGTTNLESKKISLEEVKPGTSNEGDTLKLKPIGIISTCFPNKRGVPRQPGISGRTSGKILLHNSVFTNPDHALQGLQDFSHLWIIFHFHRNDSTHIRAKVAPPRLNGIRTGVFSTRSPHRPCPIGLSLVKILKIDNYTIYFEGVDMVDQTPVLDIKPYIPQYDNPLHIEKLCNRLMDFPMNEMESVEYMEESINLIQDQTSNLNTNFGSNNDSRNRLSDFYLRNGSYNIVQETDVSRDEEIALRLQAEEFQGYPNLENYLESRNYIQSSELNSENTLQNNENTNSYEMSNTIVNTSSNSRSDFTATIESNTYVRSLESDSEDTGDLNTRLQDVTFNDQNNVDSIYTLRNERDNYTEIHTSRNSRLLDGADGPNTVCGTDLDLLHRCALNSRVDNSPVRMGIREAPDGEEGFQPQTLTPSQTLSNFPVSLRTTTDNNLLQREDINLIGTTELRENASFEVRIPEWISRPNVRTLSVVFNERALIHLNEILEDKAEEERRAIESVLREDPRSVYLRQRWGNQFYTFLIHNLHITCKFDDSRGIVTVFHVRHAGRVCECGQPEWQCLGHSPIS
ncbi:tRNA (adenine(37)-N6)-methyltransferase [Vespula pensylvanica]|uniref:TsaA-like domain-containing protein n=1 Tax=Vespula pensylvanica TaxID=30213 RepID=A0A834MZM9_VESPE|nr:tRNA (adenine(37)-N6)-methyltransferase [Vespula pensylvanica]KAF7390380.1 hypothetical protein H0235_017542 [Vespula pensylvanica]